MIGVVIAVLAGVLLWLLLAPSNRERERMAESRLDEDTIAAEQGATNALEQTQVVDVDNSRVLEQCRDAGLVQEHVDELTLLGEVRVNRLYDHQLSEVVVAHLAREEHLGHSAHGDSCDQLVLAELLPGLLGPGRASPLKWNL